MVPQRGRARLPRPRCSLDAPSPLSGRKSRGSAAQPGRCKPAYSQRASAQMKFQRGACLGPRIFPGRVPAGYRQALHPGSPKPANTSRYILGDNRIFQGAIQLISQCLDACQMLGLGALCRATGCRETKSSQSPKPSRVGSVEVVASCSFGPGLPGPTVPFSGRNPMDHFRWVQLGVWLCQNWLSNLEITCQGFSLAPCNSVLSSSLVVWGVFPCSQAHSQIIHEADTRLLLDSNAWILV